jgi:hypothetical protein
MKSISVFFVKAILFLLIFSLALKFMKLAAPIAIFVAAVIVIVTIPGLVTIALARCRPFIVGTLKTILLICLGITFVVLMLKTSHPAKIVLGFVAIVVLFRLIPYLHAKIINAFPYVKFVLYGGKDGYEKKGLKFRILFTSIYAFGLVALSIGMLCGIVYCLNLAWLYYNGN